MSEQTTDQAAAEIARCFAEAFDLPYVDPDQDFFDLGGDSLLGESLAIRISEYAGRPFQVSSIARHSTPRKIAAFLLNGEARADAASGRPPIFMVHGRLGIMLPRPEFLQGLAPGQKLHMFELPGIRGGTTPHTHIEAIAADYVRELQAAHPRGPILLGGFCTASFIVLEMAAQLAGSGRPILQMVLFDPQNGTESLQKYFRRSRGGKEPALRPWRSRRWYRRQLTHLRYFLNVGRWTDGSRDEDFRDERVRLMHETNYRRRLAADEFKSYYSRKRDFDLSRDAQAKLLAAYDQYRPQPYPGPVTVFASKFSRRRFEHPSSLWSWLLPNRSLHVLGETHNEVLRARAATGARLMQDVFDKALSRHAQPAQSGKPAPAREIRGVAL